MTPESLHPTAEDLFAYRDGELPPERRSLLEAHVIGCSQCGARLEAMSSAEGELRGRPDDVDDAYYARMTESVMGRIGAGAPAGAETRRAESSRGERRPDEPGEAAPGRVERRRPETSPEEGTRRSKAGSWLGIAGTVAAAAAVVVVVALLARHQGDWVRAPRPGVLGGPGATSATRAGESAKGEPETNAGRQDQSPPQAPANEPAPASPPLAAKTSSEAPSPEARALATEGPRAEKSAAATPPGAGAPAAAGDQANVSAAPQQQASRSAAPLVKTQSAADAIGQAAPEPGAGPAPSGEDYQRIVRTHGLPTTWDGSVGREALLGAEAPLRALYMSGRAGGDSARIRLYLAEAERLRLASPSDSAGVDRILHHYWRAIRLSGGDAALAALARKRLLEFQSEVGERP